MEAWHRNSGTGTVKVLGERRGPGITAQVLGVVGLGLAGLMALGTWLGLQRSANARLDLMERVRAAFEATGALPLAPPPASAEGATIMIVGTGLGALLLLVAVGVVLQLRVRGPLRRLTSGLRIVTAGNFRFRFEEERFDELGDLTIQLNIMTAELERNQERLREYGRGLERGVAERTEQLARRTEELARAYTEKDAAYTTLQTAQMTLLQQERMATLGQLLAGIAHEINNPVNFMVNAIRPLQRNVEAIDHLLMRHEEMLSLPVDVEDSVSPRPDLHRLMGDIQASVDLIRAGADRTAAIVQNLRSFSRSSGVDVVPAQLTEGLDVTLSLLAHALKGRIEIVRRYDDVGPVRCVPGEINQVFMNLLSNAAQAIEGEGTITITVAEEGKGVVVRIADDGPGIPEDVLPRIFDPFFTTKDATRGTGLGLSISQSMVDRHGGSLTVHSRAGEGTEFRLWLPKEAAIQAGG